MEINSSTHPALPPQAVPPQVVSPKASRKADADQPLTADAASSVAQTAPATDTVETGAAAASATKPPSSGAKCFAYGVLGVERPDDTTPATDHSYSVGNWTGAALKIGGIVALLA